MGGRRWSPKQAWLPVSSVALLYAGHWFYGALLSDTALLMGMAASILLAACLLDPKTREDLLRLRGLEAPAALFAATVIVALWTLTPWTPGGPNPVWAYVGVSPGASTIDKSATTIEIIKLLGLACVFMVGAATGARDDRARLAVQLTIWIGVAFGLWAFIGSVTGLVYQTQGHRLEGHFLNPNTAGTFFAVLLMLGIAEFRRQARHSGGEADLSRTILKAAAPLTFAVCLLDTASRGAALSFLGASVVLVLVQMAAGALKPSRALFAVLGGVVVLVGLVWLAGEELLDRFFHSGEASIVRTAIWKAHWGAFLDSPLFGYGLGAAETVNKTLISGGNYPILRPIYWIATTLVLLLAAPAAMSGELVAHFAKSLAFIPQASPYKDGIWPLLQPGWTLNYEMFFYLVFAAGLAARRLIPVVATTLAALVAAGLVLKSENPLWLTYTNPLLLEFMAGLALARWRDRLLGSAWLGWLLPAGFLALLLSTLWAPDPVGPAAGGWTRVAAWGLPALAIVAGGAAIETAGRLPRLPWLRRLGDASYAIYLFQGWPLKLATRLAERAQVPGAFELPLLIALGLVTTSATGLAIHYAVEAPLGRALNRTIGGKPRAARAAQPVNPASRLRTVGEE